MRTKNFYIYFSLLCINVFIAFVSFLSFRLDPFHQVFSNVGDGLKNSFTLVSYVKEPASPDGIFKYNTFSYPYGDYVYYTDNTPLFAIPYRWICLHVHDVSAYALVTFNILIILTIIISSFILYKIFRQLLDEHVFSYIMAIILPWTNTQVLRIWRGHYNLSFSFLILLAIWLMILWHKNKNVLKKQIGVGIAMVLLTIAGFLAHGYYLAILGMFITSMLFFYGLFSRRERYGKTSLIASAVYPILSLGLTMLLLLATDRYLPLRKETAHGYDDMFQKTRVLSLYNHYTFEKIFFPFYYDGADTTGNPDKAAYLGNIGLYALAIIVIIMLISKPFRLRIAGIQKIFFKSSLNAAILISSVIMLSVSMGEVYTTAYDFTEHGYKFVNIFNPFLYLHLVTNRVEQFRVIIRFVWPFYFGFYIWLLYTLVSVYRESGKKLKTAIIIAILFLGGSELIDFVVALQDKTNNENYLSAEHIKETVPGHLNPEKYQAILPIPYYFVGSEDFDITLDDDDDWSRYTYLLHLNTGLPLMSSKMSRTPPLMNKRLMEFVAYDSLDKDLKEKLNNKPILVAVNKRLLTDMSGGNVIHCKDRINLYTGCLQFAARHHLEPVDSANGVIFYDYFPK